MEKMSREEILYRGSCPHKKIKYGFSGFYQTEETVCYLLPGLRIMVCAVCMDCGLKGSWDWHASNGLPTPRTLRKALNRFFHFANKVNEQAEEIRSDETFIEELRQAKIENCGRVMTLVQGETFKRSD